MSDDDNVVHVQFRAAYPVEAELQQKLEEVIYSFAGKISIPSVLGVLKLVELDLVENAYGDE